MTLSIHCELSPAAVPVFENNSANQSAFPTKLDLIIADMDGDKIITEADRALWEDPNAVAARRALLNSQYNPEYDASQPDKVYLPLEKQSWWKAGTVVVTMRLEGANVPLQWHKDDWELELILPEKFINLQVGLTHVRAKQREFEKELLTYTESVMKEHQRLSDETYAIFAKNSSYQHLIDTINHINNTYVRL